MSPRGDVFCEVGHDRAPMRFRGVNMGPGEYTCERCGATLGAGAVSGAVDAFMEDVIVVCNGRFIRVTTRVQDRRR